MEQLWDKVGWVDVPSLKAQIKKNKFEKHAWDCEQRLAAERKK